MARTQMLTMDEMVFLLRSVTYDAQRIRDYARLTVDVGDVSELFDEWFVLANVQPKYRLALCIERWTPRMRTQSVRLLTARHQESALAASLAHAVTLGEVRDLIMNENRSFDLDGRRRTDLIRHVADPLEREFGTP
jgi:hypothetical protein